MAAFAVDKLFVGLRRASRLDGRPAGEAGSHQRNWVGIMGIAQTARHRRRLISPGDRPIDGNGSLLPSHLSRSGHGLGAGGPDFAR